MVEKAGKDSGRKMSERWLKKADEIVVEKMGEKSDPKGDEKINEKLGKKWSKRVGKVLEKAVKKWMNVDRRNGYKMSKVVKNG